MFYLKEKETETVKLTAITILQTCNKTEVILKYPPLRFVNDLYLSPSLLTRLMDNFHLVQDTFTTDIDPPETLLRNEYTSESDVWSAAVVILTIITRGNIQ